jgi:hypothetical protein
LGDALMNYRRELYPLLDHGQLVVPGQQGVTEGVITVTVLTGGGVYFPMHVSQLAATVSRRRRWPPRDLLRHLGFCNHRMKLDKHGQQWWSSFF